MMTRNEALQILASDNRFAQLTAGEALEHLTQAFKIALEPRDLAFFEFHAPEPSHEVARACLAGWVWTGDENSDQRQKPHWEKLERQVVRDVIRKN